MKPAEVKDPPKPSTFTYPEGPKLKGEVIKEIGERKKGETIGDYYFVIQRIRYPELDEDFIRFGYYRKKPGQKKFRWASQFTYHAPVGFTRNLIEKAEKQGLFK